MVLVEVWRSLKIAEVHDSVSNVAGKVPGVLEEVPGVFE